MEKRLIILCILSFLALCTSACSDDTVVIGPYDSTPLPTAPSTMVELVASLSDIDYQVRLSSIYALRDMGPAAGEAVPALIVALSDDVSDVRTAAVYALGAIGSEAEAAVPALVQILRSDEYESARVAAAESLGKIGNVSAVPALAGVLWDQKADMSLLINASQAIAWLTGNKFPDSEPGSHGYKLNDKGKPVVVVAAQEWWKSKGQYQDWPAINNE